MLIFQIALGILAGYLLLQFLDSVIALVVIAVVLVIVLAAAGGLLAAMYEYPGLLVLLVFVAGGIAYFVYKEARLPIRRTERAIEELEKNIEFRKSNRYDVSDQYQALRALQDNLANEHLQDERERRKRLGYDE